MLLRRSLSLFVVALAAGMWGCSRDNASTGCQTSSVSTGYDEEVCIPAATFKMGHAKLPMIVQPDIAWNPAPANDWFPEHDVRLPSYFIDKYEVTWGRYRACFEAGVCRRGGIDTTPLSRQALTDPAFEARPVFNVFYEDAAIFCAWAGRRLPSEPEWERAARGTDGRDFPWGNALPDEATLTARVNYGIDVGSWTPAAVTAASKDISVDGVVGLFTGVPEWVADWYDPDAYTQLDPREAPTAPTGPVVVVRDHEYGYGNVVSANGERGIRGDRWSRAGQRAWDTDHQGAPVWFRGKRMATSTGTGFRCARDDASSPPATTIPVYRRLNWRPSPLGAR